MTLEVKDVKKMLSCSESRRSAKSCQLSSHSCVLEYPEKREVRAKNEDFRAVTHEDTRVSKKKKKNDSK